MVAAARRRDTFPSVQDNNVTDAGTESPRYRMLVLAMLVLVYTFNFIDRQIASPTPSSG